MSHGHEHICGSDIACTVYSVRLVLSYCDVTAHSSQLVVCTLQRQAGGTGGTG